jgi:hypothetical protein
MKKTEKKKTLYTYICKEIKAKNRQVKKRRIFVFFVKKGRRIKKQQEKRL